MKLAEIPELKKASTAQKIDLIDELWASIPAEALPTPRSHLTELRRRAEAIERDPARALTPEQARKRIRAKCGL